MDVEIFKLSKQGDKRQLVEFLNDTSDTELLSFVSAKLEDYHAANDLDTVLILRAVLLGSPVEGGYTNRRFLVIKGVIQWLSVEDKENSEKSKQATSVVNLILPEVELLPADLLQEAGIMITNTIDENKRVQLRILDILAKIWNVLGATDKEDALTEIFDSLLDAEWNNQLVVGIASTLNEMELSNQRLERVVKYMTKKLSDIEMEEVPPFIYQMLLISRKGYKRLILSGILDYFNNASSENASRMEGTVMLHISFAIKQDQDLGNELVKLIKSNKASQLEVFNVACLLSAARIHRLQDTIFDLFKLSIIAVHKDKDRTDRSVWIAKYSPLDAEKYGKVLLDVVEKSASGWDQVIQSLTQLALILIDTAANATTALPTMTNAVKTRSSNVKHDIPYAHVADLGLNILLRLFKYHDVVRSEVLEQITSRIVSRSNSATEFLKLLERIIKDYPDAVEKYLTTIKDTLDFLSFLPLSTAQHLLAALQPISKTNEQFRDGLILILRKSLFAKDLDGRQMAVGGFLNILDDQITEIKHSENDGQTAAAEGVAFEILGLLRRCFSQQCEIRTSAYNGLGSLSQEHASFAGDIFELLYTQFMRSFEKDGSITNPIKLEACVENATNGGYPKIQEPIHILIANLVKVVKVAQSTNVSTVTKETMSRFDTNMKSFVHRLSRAALEDFELDKITSFDQGTHIGLRNTQYATLILGCYEIAMEYEFTANGITAESSEMLLTLFKKRKEFLCLLSSSTTEKGRKASLNVRSCVNMEFMSSLFLTVFSKDVSKEELAAPTRELRKEMEFVQFIVSSGCDGLKSAIDDEFSHQDDRYFEANVEICQTYMHILSTQDSESPYANHDPKKKSAPSVLMTVIDSLHTLLQVVSNVWPGRLVELLIHLLDPSGEEAQVNSTKPRNRIIIEVILRMREIVLRYMSGRTPIYKEVSQVMQVVLFLIGKIDKKDESISMRLHSVSKWLDDMAKERPLEDPSLAKDIISTLIKLCATTNELDIVQSLSEDLHLSFGDTDDSGESQMDSDLRYTIITEKTISTITNQVFEFLDSSFDDLTWCIGRLKLCDAGPDEEVTRNFEKEMCKRIVSVMIILSELVRSMLKDMHAEGLFKTLAKAYKTLHAFVKYKICFPQDISQDFINVITKAGTEITDKMYKFLTAYGQKEQPEAASRPSAKKKGKKKEVDQKEKLKIQRESKIIPALIYAVEQFERYLIQLSRKSKVDFMQYMKRSTSRDFRIKYNLIQQQQSSDEEEEEQLKKERRSNNDDEQEEGEEENDSARPSRKRARRQS